MSARRLVALSLVILLAACGGGGASVVPGSGAPAGLDGRTFLSTAVSGRSLVPGSRVRLTFHDGTIGASAGCNSMSGGYAIDGNVLRAGQLATTEMACPAPLMAQDDWLSRLLEDAVISLDGNTLTLSRDGVTLTLLDRKVADPDRPLVGTRWVVDSLISGDAVSSVPWGVAAALMFSGHAVAVETGCNAGTGSVTITDTTLSFGPIGLTKKSCDGSAMAMEQAIMAVLEGEVGYTIEAGTLTLRAGTRGLILRAQP